MTPAARRRRPALFTTTATDSANTPSSLLSRGHCWPNPNANDADADGHTDTNADGHPEPNAVADSEPDRVADSESDSVANAESDSVIHQTPPPPTPRKGLSQQRRRATDANAGRDDSGADDSGPDAPLSMGYPATQTPVNTGAVGGFVDVVSAGGSGSSGEFRCLR